MSEPTPAPPADDSQEATARQGRQAACPRPLQEPGQHRLERPHAEVQRDRGLRPGNRRRCRRQARRAGGCGVHDVVFSRRRGTRHAPGVLRVQRRARLGVDLAAPGRARSEAGRHSRGRLDAAAALHRDRQPGIVVRALRPRVHRSAAHRLFDHRQRGGAQEDAECRRRRRRAGGMHAGVAGAPSALELAGLPGRRKLRHDARRGAGREAAGHRRRVVGPHPGVVRDGPAEPRLRAAQRPALRAVPARALPRSRNTTASSPGALPSRPRRRARPPKPS